MKKVFILPLLLISGCLAVITSCKKDLTCEGCPGNNIPPKFSKKNRPPVARAGSDQTITLPTNSVMVSGISSNDPDNNIAGYLWTKISGPLSFNIAIPDATQTQISNLVAGVYNFELKVTDTRGLFSKDSIKITVLPQTSPPTGCNNTDRPVVNAQLVPFGMLSRARLAMAVASTDNKILFAGGITYDLSDYDEYWGTSRVDIYDIVTQTWSIAELSTPRSAIAAVSAGKKVFFAGGEHGDGAFNTIYSTVDIYDGFTNTWSVANLSQPRSYIAAATVGNKVFFAGGEKDWNYNTSDRIDIYDISTNTWSTRTLSEARAYISAVTVGNKVYFAGGHREDRWYADPSNRIDIYDNVTNSWSVSTLGTLTGGSISGATVAGNIYWSAGCNVEARNVTTGSTTNANLFSPSEITIDHGQNAVVKGNKIIYFRHLMNGPTDKFDIYDVSTNTWSIGVLPQNSIGYSSIISVNNTIYVAGGAQIGNSSNVTRQVWKLEF